MTRRYGEYDNCEIMELRRYFELGATQFYELDDWELDELYLVRWNNDGSAFTCQKLENLCITLDKLEEMFG